MCPVCFQQVGLTADRSGAVPNNDVAKLTRFGDFVKECYGTPAAVVNSTAAGAALSLSGPDDYVELAVPKGHGGKIDRVWLREDITTGQLAQQFQVLASFDGGQKFRLVGNGTSVARKRIVQLPTHMAPDMLRFQVTRAAAWPVPIKEAAAFNVCASPRPDMSVAKPPPPL